MTRAYPFETEEDGRFIAVLSYVTVVGWMAAFVMHLRWRTSLGAYHLRQTGLLFLLSFSLYVLEALLIPGWLAYGVLTLLGGTLLLLWLYGLQGAIQGEERPMPLIGRKAQAWIPIPFQKV